MRWRRSCRSSAPGGPSPSPATCWPRTSSRRPGPAGRGRARQRARCGAATTRRCCASLWWQGYCVPRRRRHAGRLGRGRERARSRGGDAASASAWAGAGRRRSWSAPRREEVDDLDDAARPPLRRPPRPAGRSRCAPVTRSASGCVWGNAAASIASCLGAVACAEGALARARRAHRRGHRRPAPRPGRRSAPGPDRTPTTAARPAASGGRPRRRRARSARTAPSDDGLQRSDDPRRRQQRPRPARAAGRHRGSCPTASRPCGPSAASSLDDATPAPDLDGVGAVLVRLHKGRSAWEAAFDELRRTLRRAAASRSSPSGASRPSTPSWPPCSTVPAGIVTEAAAYLALGGPANLANLLRFVADTRAARGLRLRSRRRELPMVGVLGDRPTTRRRPTVAVVTYRANVLAGKHAADRAALRRHRGARRQRPGRVLLLAARRAGPTARAPSPPLEPARATPTSSSPPRGRPAGPSPSGDARDISRRRGMDVAARRARRAGAAGRRRHRHHRGLGRPRRGALAARRHPRRRHPRVRRPHHRPGLRLQGGRRRRRRARRRARPPTAPCPTGSSGSPAWPCASPASAARRRPTSGWPSCSPRTRPSAAASATPSPSTRRPASCRCSPRSGPTATTWPTSAPTATR